MTVPASILFNSYDCGSTLYNYVSYESWNLLNSQEIKEYSSGSSDNITFDTEQEIIDNGIFSDVKRYIKFRNIISKITAGDKVKIYQDKFSYNSQEFNCYIADFKDRTVQSVLEEIAGFINYELGTENFKP